MKDCDGGNVSNVTSPGEAQLKKIFALMGLEKTKLAPGSGSAKRSRTNKTSRIAKRSKPVRRSRIFEAIKGIPKRSSVAKRSRRTTR